MKYIILSKTYAQAKEWAAVENLNPVDWVFMFDTITPRGRYSNDWKVVYVGDYWNRNDLETLYDSLESYGFMTGRRVAG